MQVDAEDHEKLQRNLKQAAITSLRRLYQQAGDRNVRQYSTLARVIRNIVGEERWRSQTVQATVETLYEAIQALPERFSDHLPERKIGRGEWVDSPERHMAELLYGYRDDEIEPRVVDGAALPIAYKQDRIPAARKIAVGAESDKTSGRVTAAIREDIATELLKMERTALSQQAHAQDRDTESASESESSLSSPSLIDRTTELRSNETPYFPRSEYHDQFAVSIREGHRVILFSGDSGNGKSRLAREVVGQACRESGGSYLWLNAASSSNLTSSITSELAIHGIEVINKSPEQLQRDLIGFISAPSGPAFVILDDTTDWQTIAELITSARHTKFVVTSTSEVLSGGVTYAAIDVSPMGDTTSTELISTLLPDATSEEVSSLCIALGGKPLAIEQVCAYITQSAGLVSIRDFLSHLDQDPAQAMDLPLANAERTHGNLQTYASRAASH